MKFTTIRELLPRWPWLAVTLLFGFFVLFKLNGSSIGMWSRVLDEGERPAGLLLFEPQRIRADEWQVWTPSALSQARQHPPFPLENLSLGGGRTPMIINLPIAYYTMLFRPQLWGFFFFDFERGFSWCWFCKIAGVIAGFVWLFSRLEVKKPIAGLGALWVLFSNYVQWWFSSPVMLPEMLATWAIFTGCVLDFFKGFGAAQLTFSFVVFVCCAINFVLCLYPPYQIPLAWLTVAIVVGFGLESCRSGKSWSKKRGLILTGVGIAAVAIILIPFWFDVHSTLTMVGHTQYPGARRSHGGDLSLFKLWSGGVAFFQTPQSVPSIYNNICEASNFYPLWPLALGVSVVVCLWKKIPLPRLLLPIGIFAVALSMFCVIRLPESVLRVTLLNLVTERRSILSLGIANIVLSCIFFDRYDFATFPKLFRVTTGVIWSVLLVGVVFWSYQTNARIFPDLRQVVFATIAGFGIVALFALQEKRQWTLVAIVTLLVITNLKVNPVMEGLGPLLGSKTFKEVDGLRAADPIAKWIVYREFLISEFVVATGAPVLSGNKVLPDMDFLHQLDPSGRGDRIYDRYGYVYCDLPAISDQASAYPMNDALYILYLPPQLPLLEQLGIRYLLFPDSTEEPRLGGFEKVYGSERSHIFIYKRL